MRMLPIFITMERNLTVTLVLIIRKHCQSVSSTLMYCAVSGRELGEMLSDFKATRVLDDEFKILISDAELEVLIRKVAKELNDKYKDSNEVIHLIGLLTGAFYFLARLSSYLTFRYQIHFLKVTSYSGEK